MYLFNYSSFSSDESNLKDVAITFQYGASRSCTEIRNPMKGYTLVYREKVLHFCHGSLKCTCGRRHIAVTTLSWLRFGKINILREATLYFV